jgi:hypothetical protein
MTDKDKRSPVHPIDLERAREQLERAEREEARRVAERVGADVGRATQGPVGPAEVVGGPMPDRDGGTHADSDAAGIPGVDPERVRKGGKDPS